MYDIVNRLRLYALDLHILGGFNKYSAALSDAADYIEKLEAQNEPRLEKVSGSVLCGND